MCYTEIHLEDGSIYLLVYTKSRKTPYCLKLIRFNDADEDLVCRVKWVSPVEAKGVRLGGGTKAGYSLVPSSKSIRTVAIANLLAWLIDEKIGPYWADGEN